MTTGPVRDGRPLAERIYGQVSADIVNGVIAAGAPLIQEQLAEAYGVSRTPIRDTLNRLAHEGLAVLVSGGGYFATSLTTEDIADVYQVRRDLEAMAVTQFDARYSEVDLARLTMMLAQASAAGSADLSRVFESSRDFHLALVEPCPNKYLLRTLRAVWDNPIQRRIIHTYGDNPSKSQDIIDRHRQLLDTARTGNTGALLGLLAACHEVDG